MKILFLDFNGVIITPFYHDNYLVEDNSVDYDNYLAEDNYGMNPNCMAWLKYIVDNTNCKIVVSSSHRYSGLNYIKQLWKENNYPGEILDITPTNLRNLNHYSHSRSKEIEHWIHNNNISNYCIVDDNYISNNLNFVQTNPNIGINKFIAHKIINILNENLEL